MAKVLRGKDKGKAIKIAQFCNDWVTSKSGKVYKLTNLEFTADELFTLAMNKNTGIMFEEYRILGNRFIRIH